MRNKRNATIAATITLIVLVVVMWLIVRNIGDPAGHPLNTLAPRGRQSWDIQNLVVPVFIVAGIVFVLVEGAIVLVAVRFRRRKDDAGRRRRARPDPRQHAARVGWTIVPALVLAVLAVFNVQTIWQLDDTSNDAIEVEVIGQQWWWEFRYDTDDDGKPDIITANQLVIPVGETSPEHPVQRRHPLVLDPGAERQEGRGARAAPTLVLHRRRAGHLPGPVHRVLRPLPRLHAHAGQGAEPADYDTWVAKQLKPAPDRAHRRARDSGGRGAVHRRSAPAATRSTASTRRRQAARTTTAEPRLRQSANIPLIVRQRAEPDAPHEPPTFAGNMFDLLYLDGNAAESPIPEGEVERRTTSALVAGPGGDEADGPRQQPGHAEPPAHRRRDRQARRLPRDLK